MRQDSIPAAVAERLSTAARRLRDARRTALDRVAVEETEWEYAGRTWSWPAGEARTYFHELAPGEREVLDGLIAELGDLGAARGAKAREAEAEEAGATDPRRPESAPEIVGIGTGRVAVAIPGPVVGEAAEANEAGKTDGAADSGAEPPAAEPLVAKLARYGPSAEMGDGRPQNRRERRIWSAVGSHPFLPVLGGDVEGDWIVMPRADVPPEESVREAALDRVRAALAPHRDRFHFDELKPENVGSYRGRYWVVDYGRPAGEPLFVEPPSGSGASGSEANDPDTDEDGGSEDDGGGDDADAGDNGQDRSYEN